MSEDKSKPRVKAEVNVFPPVGAEWLRDKDLVYVTSPAEAKKQARPFAVEGSSLAHEIQNGHGFDFLEKTNVRKPEGKVPVYLFAPRKPEKGDS